MNRILVVAESSRTIGEFRARWVRAMHRAYVQRYRAVLAGAVARLEPSAEVTALAGREFVDPARLPRDAAVRFYDDESFKAEARPLADLAARIVANWWADPDREPELRACGVWLPDLMPVAKGILIRLEVLEYLSAVERLIDETKPQRVVLVTGASMTERLARAVADDRGIAVAVARRFPPSFALAKVRQLLEPRAERRRLRALLIQPRRPVPTAGPCRVAFAVCQPRHFDIVAPLALSLHRQGVGTAVLASTIEGRAMDAGLARLASEGVPCAYFMDHLPAADARRIARELQPLGRRLLRRLDQDPNWDAGARHGGARLGPIVAPFARSAVRWGLPTARLYLEAASRALDVLRPDAVVIVSDRRPPERAMAFAARARGIPTALFWGGSVLGRDQMNVFDVTDRVLLIGDHLRGALVHQGVDARRLAVMGDPRSHAVRRVPRDQMRTEVLRDFGLSADRPLLVIVSKYASVLFSSVEKEGFYRTVIQALHRLDRSHVVVKAHPNEDLALLREQLRAWGWPDALVTQSYDIHRLFRAATAAIMITSMAGIEAMTLECPVVAVQTKSKDFEGKHMPPYVRERAVERVDAGDPQTLAAVLGRLIADPAARDDLVARGGRFAARYIDPVNGGLGARLLGIFEEIRADRAREPSA